MVVLLSTVRWSYLWQRHQSLAAAAATRGPVVFVESQPRRLRQVVGNPLRALRYRALASPTDGAPRGIRLVAPSPWAVLTPRRWARRQADRIRQEAAGRGGQVGLYAPSRAFRELAGQLAATGADVAYDAVIDWSSAPTSWHAPRRAALRERQLPADWRVVSDSPVLAADLTSRLDRPVPVVLPAADEAF